MALVTENVNLKTFENQPVFLLVNDADFENGRIARKYHNAEIEFFANYVLVNKEVLIPRMQILKISLVDF